MILKKIKVSSDGDMPASIGNRHYPPSFSVDAEQMPEIKNWEVGAKYRLVIEVEQTSKNENEHMVTGGFNIVAYKHLPTKSIDDMTDKEFAEYQDESLSKGNLA